jgi:hypothetical protein
MPKTWSVQDAKAHLSEVLRRARAGEPQRIGLSDGCILVAERDWHAARSSDLGAWLVSSAPRGEPVPEAPRTSRRGDPFATDAG